MTRWSREDGQAFSEYLVVLGMTVLMVVASLAFLVRPIALAFVALARRLVMDLSS
jgi:hypothetical protein